MRSRDEARRHNVKTTWLRSANTVFMETSASGFGLHTTVKPSAIDMQIKLIGKGLKQTIIYYYIF